MLDRGSRTAGQDATAEALARVRVVMRGARAQGWRFAEAWQLALELVDDETVREAMTATRGAWLRSFRGTPATRAESAASLLVTTAPIEDDERADAVVVG